MSKSTTNLKDRYINEVRAKLKEEFSYSNDMQIPKMVLHNSRESV